MHDDVKLLGSARGRVGWAPDSNWLLYGTGGLGWERLEQSNSQTFTTLFPPFGSQTFATTVPVNLFGWVAGAGVEARLFGSNWIGRLEYLHYDFGHSRFSSSFTSTIPGAISSSNTVGNQTIDVVRAGLSYKFGNWN